jgi:hypothetical protein
MSESSVVHDGLILPVYSRRWHRADEYQVKVTKTGWRISYIVHNGDCDPSGHPFLYDNFNQNYIHRPPNIGFEMQSLWQNAVSGKMSREEVQFGLYRIAQIIEESERTPRTRSGKLRR